MASLKDLIVMGPARFLDKLYGNLEGNAATATKLQTARTLTLGNSSINFDGSESKTFNLTVSNTWTGGTTAGPTLSTTVNGTTGTAVAIPSASSAASGVVTIADQSFRGMKTFYGAVRGYMYNLNNNAPAFLFDKPSSHWTGIGACGENDTIFFGPCTPDSNVAGGYSWVANYNQKWKFQGDIYTTNLINATGTITSASTITGNRFVISNSSSAAAHIEFSRVGWNYIIGPSGSTIAISPTGSTGADNARLVIDSTSVYPGANNGTIDLGTSSYKWNNVYGNNFSGNAASATSAAKAGYLVEDESFNLSRHSLQYFNISGTAGNAFKVNDTPTSAWWHIMRCTHANSTGYYTDLAIPFNDVSLYYKRISAGEVKNGGWIKVLDSNNYTSYTVKKDGTGASGTWDITSNHTNHLTIWPNSPGTATTANSPGLYIIGAGGATVGNTVDYSADTPNTHSSSVQYGTILRIKYNNTSVYYTDIYSDTNSNALLYKTVANGTSKGWLRILDSNNYTSYTITKTGSGASGTWGISITGSSASCTGNAASATKLATARTIFGQSFNGTANVVGKVFCYGSYNATVNSRYGTGAIEIRENGQVGNAQTDIGYAPQIGFHWANTAAGQLALQSNGKFKLVKQNGDPASLVANLDGYASSAGSANSALYLRPGGEGSTASVRTQDSGIALITGGWASTSAGYLHQYGTTLDVSGYSTWYHRLAFNTTGIIEYWQGINTTTLGKIGYLYTSQNIIYSSTEPTAPCVGAIWLKPV